MRKGLKGYFSLCQGKGIVEQLLSSAYAPCAIYSCLVGTIRNYKKREIEANLLYKQLEIQLL
jgi:hypothetical protein